MTRTRTAVLLAFVTAFAGCAAVGPSPQKRYEHWFADHRTDAQRYEAFLRGEGVGDTVPMSALTRTARSWERCGNHEFTLPPDTLWSNMPSTLHVVRQLHLMGILDPALARSVYRDPEMNECAGGSSRSKHMENRAIDFDLPKRADNVEKLCAFWREHGPALNMGLGFYTPTAIHIDTAGFRTWGEDHTRNTSLCRDPTVP